MSDTEENPRAAADIPEWDDEYLDRVADRLAGHYDLERDGVVHGERFDLVGELLVENQKQFLHESINFANHHKRERVYARRTDGATVAELERLADLGRDLGEAIDADEQHQGTEFTFVLLAPALPDDVRSFVEGFRERNLIRYGYYGHYEVNLAVVAPDTEELATSKHGETGRAFALWAPLAEPAPDGLLRRLVARLRR